MLPEVIKYLLVTLTVFLTGCVSNPYAEYYQAEITRIHSAAKPEPFEPRIRYVSDRVAAEAELLKQGYFRVGQSSFRTSKDPGEAALKEQANAVTADHVVVFMAYSGTNETIIPVLSVTPPSQETTAFTGKGTVETRSQEKVDRSEVSFSGTVTTKTPVAYDAKMVPIYRDEYNVQATFFRSRALQARDTSDPTGIGLKKGGTATVPFSWESHPKGLIVTGLSDMSSPVQKGDIITKIGDWSVVGMDFLDALKVITGAPGSEAELEVLRGETVLKVRVARSEP